MIKYKRKFHVNSGIEWDRIGLGILIERWEAYRVGNPNAYYFILQFGPIYIALIFDWSND